MYFRLTNEFVANYEYSNGEGNVTNSFDPADDVMTVAIVLRVALCACAAHNMSVNSPYRYMIPKIQFISNKS